ncbi:MAG: response regulator [Firmicutes bacterium]|nr:response regulator [Bacillota bacterium]
MSRLKHILIVEDHALVAKFYCMALERAGGFTCWVSEDVEAILAAVAEGRVDLVVLDVALSGAQWAGRSLDGIELARLIQQAAKATGRTVPILLATAHAMAGDRERLLAASGADEYLEKPVYDAEMLVRTVRRLLGADESA